MLPDQRADIGSQAVIYCRVSTLEQTKNLSLETQRTACVEYCQRCGYEVAQVFVEEGESARTADRTELKRLLDYVRQHKGQIGAVVVYSISRFARAQHDHVVLRALLGTIGVTLRSVTEAFDDTSTGRLTEALLSAISQFDNETRAERTQAGMMAAMDKGRWPFRPPLGYQRAPSREIRSAMVPDPERAPLITLAFKLFATGKYTKRQVLSRVTARGLRTRKGKKLTDQSFEQLLKNEVYTGWVVSKVWGKRVRGIHTPLVDEETFHRVQALRLGRGFALTPHVRNNEDFPLRAFIRCEECGRPLTGSWSQGRHKQYAYYRCQNNCVSVRKNDLEKLFLAHLKQMTPKKEYVALFRASVLDVWEERKKEASSQARELDRRLEELEHRRNQLETAFLFDKSISKDTYDRQYDALRQEMALTKVAKYDQELDEIDIEGLLACAERLLLSPAQQWLAFSLDQRQRFQKILFPAGLSYKNGRFGTAQTCVAFEIIAECESSPDGLVRPAGIEPATSASAGQRSIR